MKIISIGEILWDRFAGSEHLGGAPFNFAAHAARMGHDVTLLSAVGADTHGCRALARLTELGLFSRFVRVMADQPTGFVSVDLRDEAQPRYVIHRPAAYDFVQLDPGDCEELSACAPDWIYYGTLHQVYPRGRETTKQLLSCCCDARRFYDVNLRAASYTSELVSHLMREADVVKLNEAEVGIVGQMLGASHNSLERFCRSYAQTFQWEAVCVTRGANGCALLMSDRYIEVDGYAVDVKDAVGAGDAFSAAFLHGLERGWPAEAIADFANRLGALVASREGAVPPWNSEECRALVRHPAA